VTALLKEQIPVRRVSYRVRVSSLWFDDECRTAKRALRLSERAVRRAVLLSDASSAAAASYRSQRHRYVTLLRQKESAFWSKHIDAQQSQPHQLWRSFDKLLGRGKTPLSSDIDASALRQFFDDKVAGVRAATARADEPLFTPAPVGCELRLFNPVTQTEIIEMVLALPDKQCLSDPLPTWLLKKSVNVLAPFLCWLFCCSIEHGVVPSSMKSAYITPILKNVDLDSSDPKSYRPISNLSVLSKLLEHLVSKQLVMYLLENDLFPDLHLAYRSNHSTETAVLKVLSDILLALDSGKLALLSLLDLLAAFDSVDHDTLLQRL